MLVNHWRQIVKIPASRDLDKSSWLPLLQRCHPRIWILAIVDWLPFVCNAEVISLAVVMAEVVLRSMCQPWQKESEPQTLPHIRVHTSPVSQHNPQRIQYPTHARTLSTNSAPSLLLSHHGATIPLGGFPPQKSVSSLYVLSIIFVCCSSVISAGFS